MKAAVVVFPASNCDRDAATESLDTLARDGRYARDVY